MRKSILKITVPLNLKFCFTDFRWRKNMINSKITLEEMTSSTAIYILSEILWGKGVLGAGTGRLQLIELLFVSAYAPKEGFQNNLVNWRWGSPCCKWRCCNHTLQDKVGKPFCVSNTRSWTLGNGPLTVWSPLHPFMQSWRDTECKICWYWKE